ncbi:hypothetical protein WA026_018204 [Henosepilachna vigintioctopunctata]|uniref:Pacifastin domain-containing protein n=1 Tax=Henosepilachna vigintioctopunctata TaxID=420089 RepID=A0AAW1VBF3_9CUCU
MKLIVIFFAFLCVLNYFAEAHLCLHGSAKQEGCQSCYCVSGVWNCIHTGCEDGNLMRYRKDGPA